jgi:hypothetical protein
MTEEVVDHVIWTQKNRGNFRLSVVARLKGPLVSNVQFLVRLTDPEENNIDYMTNLEGFKDLGELSLALHHFCKLPIYANQKHVDKLKELLNAENIKAFAEIVKTSKIG